MERWSCTRRLVSPLPRSFVSVRPPGKDGRSFLDPRLAALVQGAEQHTPSVTVGMAAAEGMICRIGAEDGSIGLSFHTPLSAPTFKHPLVLRDGLVIVQWPEQILLVYCRERRVARIAFGSGPVAVVPLGEIGQGGPHWNDSEISDPEVSIEVVVPARPQRSIAPSLAQVFFRHGPSEFPESWNIRHLHISDPSASLNDPGTHRKSGFKLRANREWGDGPETQAASGFAAF